MVAKCEFHLGRETFARRRNFATTERAETSRVSSAGTFASSLIFRCASRYVAADLPSWELLAYIDFQQGNETRMGKGKGTFEYWACR